MSFPTLPTELILQIFAKLSPSDLLAALLVCSEMKAIAKPLLYASVTIHSETHLDCFIRTVIENPDLASLVRSYSLQFTDQLDVDMDQFDVGIHDRYHNRKRGDQHARVLGFLPNLEHLRIYSQDDYSWRESYLLFSQFLKSDSSKLPHISTHLKSLHIDHWDKDPNQRDEFWSLEYSTSIFFLPRLESLTLCNAAVIKYYPELESYKLPIAKLRLINCELEPKTLAAILGISPNLQHLEIWTSTYNNPEIEPGEEPKVLENWADFLQPARETLQNLVLSVRLEGEYRKPQLLRILGGVKHLAVPWWLIESSSYSTELLDQIFPPNLEILTLLCGNYDSSVRWSTENMVDILVRMEKCSAQTNYLPTLRRIEFKTATPFELPADLVAACGRKGIELEVNHCVEVKECFYERGYIVPCL